MRSILVILNITILIVLGIFAKDNLLAKFNLLTPSEIPNSGSIEVVFSPNNGATAAIIKALDEARESVLVSAYSFTSQDLAHALLEAKKRNVLVRLILDKSQLSQRYSSSRFFRNQGFDLRIDVKHAIFHNKVMIIDDITVITGSFNFTKAAESKNAENLLVIRNNPQLARLYKQNWLFHWNQSLPVESYFERKAQAEVTADSILR